MVRCKVCAAEVTTDVWQKCGAKIWKDVSKVKVTEEKGEKIEAPKEMVYDDVDGNLLKKVFYLYADAIPDKMIKVSKIDFSN